MASPYSPSSRLFINVIYIDPERAPCFDACSAARDRVASASFQERLATLRTAAGVNYAGVTACKLEVLEQVHAYFRRHASESQLADYRAFIAVHGRALEDYALFHAIQGRAAAAPEDEKRWPAAYAGPKEDLHVYLLIGQSNMAGSVLPALYKTGFRYDYTIT